MHVWFYAFCNNCLGGGGQCGKPVSLTTLFQRGGRFVASVLAPVDSPVAHGPETGAPERPQHQRPGLGTTAEAEKTQKAGVEAERTKKAAGSC